MHLVGAGKGYGIALLNSWPCPLDAALGYAVPRYSLPDIVILASEHIWCKDTEMLLDVMTLQCS